MKFLIMLMCEVVISFDRFMFNLCLDSIKQGCDVVTDSCARSLLCRLQTQDGSTHICVFWLHFCVVRGSGNTLSFFYTVSGS